jgi:predicted aspartyl protease
MFKGRFGNTSEAPYLEALVILPNLGIRSGVSFLVDTGADETVLMPADAVKMGVNYKKLQKAQSLVGIGGRCDSFKDRAVIVLFDHRRNLIFGYDIEIKIVDYKAAITKLGFCPSLLGRDILKRLKMR